MSYELAEQVIRFMTAILGAYMWTYLLPLPVPGRKRRASYFICVTLAMQIEDRLNILLYRSWEGVVPQAVLSGLPVLSAMFAFVIMTPLLSHWFTGHSVRECMLTGLKVMVAMVLADGVMSFLLWPAWSQADPTDLSAMLQPSAARLIMQVASQSVMYLLLLLLYLSSRPKGRRRLWHLVLFPLWGISTSNVLLTFLVRYCGQSLTVTVLLCMAVTNLVLLICTNQLFRYMEQYFSYQRLAQRRRQAGQARELQADYEALARMQARELREVCITIRQTLYDAFPPEGAPSTERTQALLRQIAGIPQVSYCANPLVNSVLTLKNRRAQELGIYLEIQVGYTDTGCIKNLDLCSLLGNLLDNAIEACIPLTEDVEPVILVSLRSQGRLFVLSVENPVRQAPQRNEMEEYPTTKPDPEHHGLGLQRARWIARQYSGDLIAETQGHTFRTIAMLNTGAANFDKLGLDFSLSKG